MRNNAIVHEATLLNSHNSSNQFRRPIVAAFEKVAATPPFVHRRCRRQQGATCNDLPAA
jgi:hypothetical protein